MNKKVKLLAVSSSGGHWIQLNRLKNVFEKYDTVFACTDPSLKSTVKGKFYSLHDANMWDKLGLVKLFLQSMWLILKIRPDVVISTGAAPGFFCIVVAKVFRKKTIWLDSIANAEEMSLAGKKIKPFADVWLTQWPEIEKANGPAYKGQVL
ncbi:UDP-N-acetylglucosamine--LPS N-acetylglucosamine transferase [Neptunomonas phycophila]|uniref:UDP-N-acetylglucosamine--LPS N-acetylglucosamine transferase n=1 Tax=Neptunomonas phycophila TaxID=1572645 RepID=A0AAW7XNH5_9GAMM|nr:UDP-N-acetylglucosamine--LPS N-acetylglucosamine transferase [Neptunomonas phycophila]MDO6454350.1 UDP-N-acetylglucosamine--LPS N-acetylglucosamine transferase [Neptunomonas phycophila]